MQSIWTFHGLSIRPLLLSVRQVLRNWKLHRSSGELNVCGRCAKHTGIVVFYTHITAAGSLVGLVKTLVLDHALKIAVLFRSPNPAAAVCPTTGTQIRSDFIQMVSFVFQQSVSHRAVVAVEIN